LQKAQVITLSSLCNLFFDALSLSQTITTPLFTPDNIQALLDFLLTGQNAWCYLLFNDKQQPLLVFKSDLLYKNIKQTSVQ
jgi:hypothetical protein